MVLVTLSGVTLPQVLLSGGKSAVKPPNTLQIFLGLWLRPPEMPLGRTQFPYPGGFARGVSGNGSCPWIHLPMFQYCAQSSHPGLLQDVFCICSKPPGMMPKFNVTVPMTPEYLGTLPRLGMSFFYLLL